MSLTISDKKVAKRAGGGVLLAVAIAYFYACDDALLGGPIIAAASKWGIVRALAFGAIACAIWNIPQTLLFISKGHPLAKDDTAKYDGLEKFLRMLGWCQPPILLSITWGKLGAVMGVVGVLLLLLLTKWLSKYRDEAEARIDSKVGRLSRFVWEKHPRWVWAALFLIGPQMAIMPMMNSGSSVSACKRKGLVFLAVYSVEFATAYVFLGKSLLDWIIGLF